ncbi:hypothetical protein [Caulobacter sp. 17J80-11]|uniref:hypothetical protein n=1 Tax=Caulobacter sp. 17J80-11 TaxID=2763502 RepID=UPI00165382D8|nr:hypothetical protein [Caulobacter sp. 17J80-11]MBC6983385.1 hypothetical protein [Caulobacter sp. 17J80-11]
MTTLISSDADIDRIGLGVIDKTLPKAEWTHAGHFAAALWLWRSRPASALGDMPDLIRAYNLATGVENTDTGGYHETITLASMRAARAELSRRPADAPLHEALDGLLASEFGRSDWPLAYWSKPVLFSVEARRAWVEPDLRALPF